MDKAKLEKMLNLPVTSVEEGDDVIKVHVNEKNIGKAIGYAGANVRAAEKILGKRIEIVKD